jgi:hypothetical protein
MNNEGPMRRYGHKFFFTIRRFDKVVITSSVLTSRLRALHWKIHTVCYNLNKASGEWSALDATTLP